MTSRYRHRFVALLITILLFAASPLGAQGTKDSTLVRANKIDLDSLARDKTAPAYSKRAQARIRVRDSLFLVRAVASTPAPVPAPAPAPAPTPEPTKPPVIVVDSAPPGLPTGIAPNVSTTGAIVAEVPRATINTTYPPVTRVVNVPAGTDLQAAINAARGGDELRLSDCGTDVGNFTLPVRADSGVVVIRTAGTVAAGRMTPTQAVARCIHKVVSPTNGPAFATALSAKGWRLVGLDISSSSPIVGAIVALGDGSTAQNSLALVASNVVLDRVYIHGGPAQQVQRCVALNSAASAVIDSWLSDCHSNNNDSQAIIGWNGPGPYLIRNNHLEGGHQGVFFGGASIALRNIVPSDIWIVGNHITRPLSWRATTRSPDGQSWIYLPGQWQTKTIIETKYVRRLLVEGNVIENVWSDAQAGFAVLIKSEDNLCYAPWAQSADVTIRGNVFRRIASGFNLAASVGDCPSVPAARLTIDNNVVESFGMGGDGIPFQLLGNLVNVTVTHNTTLNTPPSNDALTFSGGVVQGFTFDANAMYQGLYGWHHDDGVNRAPGTAYRTNVVIGADCQYFPASTACPANPPATYPTAFDGRAIGADTAAVNAATRNALVAP